VSGPLSGVRVLDFTALVQGPMATQMLGDLGADVIKIEKVGGEWMRFWGILNGKSHGEMDSFLAFNRNKRSAEADLRDPQIRDRVLELAADADVIVENFRPGVMARLGLDYDDVRVVNPRIIYASSSGYGQSGPYVKRPGQDLLIQALSGLMCLTGRAGDPPTALGVGITDQYAALHIVIAVLAALHHRAQTGEGQKVEVDLFSCSVAMQQQELTFYRNQGFLPERPAENLGSIWSTAPFGIYETSDGHIAIAMTPCPVLAEALDQPWLAEYDTLDKMVESRAEIYAGLSAHLLTRTRAHWIDVLLAHDVWCAPVQSYEELVADEQVAHNRLFWEVPVGEGEATFLTPGSPITFSSTAVGIRHGVPRSGQHTAEVLADSSPWEA
jgi:crotonobetainyl-CoA:carnitine CoA-transferase CaiB-like acyl-CoA transferase